MRDRQSERERKERTERERARAGDPGRLDGALRPRLPYQATVTREDGRKHVMRPREFYG